MSGKKIIGCLLVVAALSVFFSGNVCAGEAVTNGGFETGDFTGWTVYDADDSEASDFYVDINSVSGQTGSFSVWFNGTSYGEDPSYISQSVDLTDVSEISFRYLLDFIESGDVFIDVAVDSPILFEGHLTDSDVGSWNTQSIDVSGYSGNHTLKFFVYGNTDFADIYIDDISALTPSSDLPVADFSADPTSGPASLEVSFTDLSTNTPTSWCWDIDNSGNCDYETQNPTHTYTEPGTYTVKLTATNAYGSDSETKTDYIIAYSSSSSCVSSGGLVCEEAQDGDYSIYKYTYDSFPALIGWIPPAGVTEVEYLVVGGGGGGGVGGGGGGAGGMLSGSGLSVTPGTVYSIAVGAGGAGGNASEAVNGGDSSFSTITAHGGGGGGYGWGGVNKSGGSGAGGDGHSSPSYGSGTDGEGSRGGTGRWTSPNYPTGGGGGKGTVGGNASSGSVAGNGGAGLASSITGSSVIYAGGGGGGMWSKSTGGTPGTGGSGGGGNGSVGSSSGVNGTDGLGGGGGGGGTYGGNGGSGVVILRFLTPPLPVADFSADPTSGPASLEVSFTDLSTGTPTSWCWDIDNSGNCDYETQNPTHTYTEPGTYTVKLTATNAYGSDSETKAGYIIVGEGAERVTNGGFETGDFTGWTVIDEGEGVLSVVDSNSRSGAYSAFFDCVGENNFSISQSVNFTDIDQFSFWSYRGDGLGEVKIDSDVVASSVGDISWQKHTIDTSSYSGLHTLQLSFSCEGGGWYVDDITTYEEGIVEADFSADTVLGTASLQVSFTDLSTGAPTSWCWDIDNSGNCDYETQNPTHTYTEPGTYTVKLTATNAYGSDSETKTGYIFVKSNNDGICGYTFGQVMSSTPTNLCLRGTPSRIYGTGALTWTWTCSGIDGGEDASCLARRYVPSNNCGPAIYGYFYQLPSQYLCPDGEEAINITSGTNWSWTCQSTNSGCSAYKITDGQCGSSDGQNMGYFPQSDNLCAIGTSSSFVQDIDSYDWSCSGINYGETASCSATKSLDAVDGQCGSSDGQALYDPPSTNLCAAGMISSLSGSGPWTWSCVGANGGSVAACSAHKRNAVALVVDDATYAELAAEIGTFKNDIEENTEYPTVYLLHDSWTSASQIREGLVSLFDNNRLAGVIFIGDIPIMRYATRYNGITYSSYPSNYYYQKLDVADWIEETSDTVTLEGSTNSHVVSVWAGTIRPPSSNSFSERIALLRSYFNRNHNYRTGELSYDEKMLLVETMSSKLWNGEDVYDALRDLADNIPSYTNLYSSGSSVDTAYALDPDERKQAILNAIQGNYEATVIHTHGSATAQWVDSGTTINFNDVIANPSNSLFVSLDTCLNGDVSNQNYIGGWYLFSGDSLLVRANSTATFYMQDENGFLTSNYLDDYQSIAAGNDFGADSRIHPHGSSTFLFGDPTLSIREKIPEEDPPSVDFAANSVLGYSPLTVSFVDLSTNTPTSWCWDIDNSGNCDYETQNPTHTYTEPGTYTVKLTATNAYGSDSETKAGYILLGEIPSADFSAAFDSSEVPFNVSFTDLSTGTPTSWCWDIDNSGNCDYETQNPTHTYTEPGTYTVKLTATNAYGSDSETKAGYVVATGDPEEVYLLKDIYSGSTGSSPSYLTAYNGYLYFSANDGTNGSELWRTDGTADGTALVKDIYSGSTGTSPSNLTVYNGYLYFRANDGTNGSELWRTDGTADGTALFKDIWSGSSSSTPFNFAAYNGYLYFSANDGTNGVELWRTDGTADGTALFKDIYSGLATSSPLYLTVYDGYIYFSATDGTNGSELWRTDGTADGTALFKDIYSGSSGSYPSYLATYDGYIYFSAEDGTNGSELWRTDGTADGTALFKDIYSGSTGSSPSYLTAYNGYLYFSANDGTNGTELWRTDGTADGTALVKDIWSGSSSSTPFNFAAYNDYLYFSANDGTHGAEPMYTYTPFPPPSSDFSATPRTGPASLEVSFTDLSTNTPTSWCWDIDNSGNCDYETQNPTHTYTEPGTYTVKLTVTNDYGSDSETKVGYILAIGDENDVFPDEEGNVTLTTSKNKARVTGSSGSLSISQSGAIDPILDASLLVSGGSGVLPQITVTGDEGLRIDIPGSTTATAGASWNGEMNLPRPTTITLPQQSGETRTLSEALEIGLSGESISFDRGVRILFPNQAGKRIGYQTGSGPFNEITSVCSADTQDVGDALSSDGSCKIDSGSDLVVWTRHFTSYATFTSSPVVVAESPSGGGGGGGGFIPSAPPVPPQGGYVFKINNGASSTASRSVALTIDGGNARNMAIGNDGIFTSQEPYAATKQWTLTEGEGKKQVCAKFYTQYGYSSDPVCAEIYLEQSGSVSALSVLVSGTKYGERSDKVKELQAGLKKLGFFPSDVNATGYYGTITRKAVIRYEVSEMISSKPAADFTREELLVLLLKLIEL